MGYRSSTTLLGLPLVHVANGSWDGTTYRRGIARGWIAIGDVAFGVVLAIGGVSVGGLALGGVALGGLSLGGLALGVVALGGGAVGLVAAGGVAIGWQAAAGGLALARMVAVGGVALAEHANDEFANQLFAESPVLVAIGAVMRHARWLVLLAVLPAVLVFFKRLRRDLP